MENTCKTCEFLGFDVNRRGGAKLSMCNCFPVYKVIYNINEIPDWCPRPYENKPNKTNNKWLPNWRVIDLRKLVKEIGGEDWHNHPVQKEWQYQVTERGKGNDTANLEWVGQSKETPLINEFLLSHGFEKDEMVLYWICW